MRKTIALLFAATVAILMPAPPASAATTDNIPVQSDCLKDAWYVNHEESNLLPTQQQDGLLFDGPSIVHHAAEIMLLDLLPGTFVADVKEGVAPVFKVETSPYSTLNYVGDGKWWSSRIATDDQGGQGSPVTAEVMATLPIIDKSWDEATSYSEQTKVVSFGVGYANDTGNKALVKSISFAGHDYDLSCQPEPSPSPTPSVTPSNMPSTPIPTLTPINPGGDLAKPSLPVTGSGFPWGLVVSGAVALAVGVVLVFAGAKKRYGIENS
jgi:hypothetical protein